MSCLLNSFFASRPFFQPFQYQEQNVVYQHLRVVPFLKEHDRVKLIWKTYGTHDIVLAILCDRDDIGSCIHDLRKELAELGVTPAKFDVSISISWEKMQLRA